MAPVNPAPVDEPDDHAKERERLLTESQARLEAAKANLDDAHTRHNQALSAHQALVANLASDVELVKWASEGNKRAQERLNEQVRAMHPDLLGFGPDLSGEHWGDFRIEQLHLRARVSPEADETSIAALAEAAFEFVRRYDIHTSNPRRAHQNYAHIATPGCSIFYRRLSMKHLRRNPRPDSAFIEVHGEQEQSGTLDEMLDASRAYDLLRALR